MTLAEIWEFVTDIVNQLFDLVWLCIATAWQEWPWWYWVVLVVVLWVSFWLLCGVDQLRKRYDNWAKRKTKESRDRASQG